MKSFTKIVIFFLVVENRNAYKLPLSQKNSTVSIFATSKDLPCHTPSPNQKRDAVLKNNGSLDNDYHMTHLVERDDDLLAFDRIQSANNEYQNYLNAKEYQKACLINQTFRLF